MERVRGAHNSPVVVVLVYFQVHDRRIFPACVSHWASIFRLLFKDGMSILHYGNQRLRHPYRAIGHPQQVTPRFIRPQRRCVLNILVDEKS